jgi:uncharacterized membrane protein
MTNVETHHNHTVAVYSTHENAESAVKVLSNNGFSMKDLSIIGQDYETLERPIGFVNAGDRMLSWGKFGAFWGTIWGLMFGSAMLFIPGVGYVLFAGYIVSAIEGAAIGGGFAAIGAALASIGIPQDSVISYESNLKAGSFLLMIHGNELTTQRAKIILESTTPERLERFSTKCGVGHD